MAESKVPNSTHGGIENWKIYATKQIKICAEYQGIVPRASAGWLGIVNPALTTDIMSRYSAQIVICIYTYIYVYIYIYYIYIRKI